MNKQPRYFITRTQAWFNIIGSVYAGCACTLSFVLLTKSLMWGILAGLPFLTVLPCFVAYGYRRILREGTYEIPIIKTEQCHSK